MAGGTVILVAGGTAILVAGGTPILVVEGSTVLVALVAAALVLVASCLVGGTASLSSKASPLRDMFYNNNVTITACSPIVITITCGIDP